MQPTLVGSVPGVRLLGLIAVAVVLLLTPTFARAASDDETKCVAPEYKQRYLNWLSEADMSKLTPPQPDVQNTGVETQYLLEKSYGVTECGLKRINQGQCYTALPDMLGNVVHLYWRSAVMHLPPAADQVRQNLDAINGACTPKGLFGILAPSSPPLVPTIEKFLQDYSVAAAAAVAESEKEESEREEAKRKADEEAARQEAQRQAEQARQFDTECESVKAHFEQVKAGSAQVSTLAEALALYQPARASEEVADQPLLEPDKGIYLVAGIIERPEGQQTAVINASPARGSTSYAMISYGQSTLQGKENLAVGNYVEGVGRYVGNADYQTIAGQSKVMPVFEVQFLRAVNRNALMMAAIDGKAGLTTPAEDKCVLGDYKGPR